MIPPQLFISANASQYLFRRVYLRVTRTVRVTILSRQNMGYKEVMHSLSDLCIHLLRTPRPQGTFFAPR